MKASEILHKAVYDDSGHKLGRVYEIEAEKTGGTWRIARLMVGPGSALLRLGYQHRHLRGPAGIKFLAERLSRYEIDWARVEKVAPKRITLDCSAAELEEASN